MVVVVKERAGPVRAGLRLRCGTRTGRRAGRSRSAGLVVQLAVFELREAARPSSSPTMSNNPRTALYLAPSVNTTTYVSTFDLRACRLLVRAGWSRRRLRQRHMRPFLSHPPLRLPHQRTPSSIRSSMRRFQDHYVNSLSFSRVVLVPLSVMANSESRRCRRRSRL